MKINCPNCGQEYDVTEEYIGQEAECEKCKQSFTISHSKLIKCPACDKIVSKEAPSCPTCGQPIKANTVSETIKKEPAKVLPAKTSSTPTETIAYKEKKIIGIGKYWQGWLSVFKISILFGILGSIADGGFLLRIFPDYKNAIGILVLSKIILIVTILVVLYKKTIYSVKITIIALCIILLENLIVIVLLMQNGYISYIHYSGILIPLLWIVYLIKSKRIASTYKEISNNQIINSAICAEPHNFTEKPFESIQNNTHNKKNEINELNKTLTYVVVFIIIVGVVCLFIYIFKPFERQQNIGGNQNSSKEYKDIEVTSSSAETSQKISSSEALNLGISYYYGSYGYDKDYKKAFDNFLIASNGGEIEGEYRLAIMYEYGLGTPKDIDAALDLYKLAAAKGHKDAISKLKEIELSQVNQKQTAGNNNEILNEISNGFRGNKWGSTVDEVLKKERVKLVSNSKSPNIYCSYSGNGKLGNYDAIIIYTFEYGRLVKGQYSIFSKIGDYKKPYDFFQKYLIRRYGEPLPSNKNVLRIYDTKKEYINQNDNIIADYILSGKGLLRTIWKTDKSEVVLLFDLHPLPDDDGNELLSLSLQYYELSYYNSNNK